ncbi:hypothetical protein DN068_20595 [Taibaiella soli]|uniref:Uncharacterized protein n=2 Tax=Taibaiella soli TaxID=1649169 RepID=A0A2W2ATV3_9BACT|nr:hypothetical protein DN068_20595 [Taibaiella soli]
MTQSISKKKPSFPVNDILREYLIYYGREIMLPVQYDDLLRFDSAIPIYDKNGKDTLWEMALYNTNDQHLLHEGLKQIYSILKTEGDSSVHKHLHVERVDYCTFGNSHPFRIKIVNNFNDNYDYFYIKRADASRIYGLELEHILSPSRINYFVNEATLVEEHIAGIPGDQFIQFYLNNPEFNKVRIAKELVKFNERCFVRLLGDMRSYNYVFDITPDFEEVQFRIRAIDFDQQSYEGRKNLYLPQFFKENYALVLLVQELLSAENIEQYQQEERSLIVRRMKAAGKQLNALLESMEADTISKPEKVLQLKSELAEFYKDDQFLQCKTMGALVRYSLECVGK